MWECFGTSVYICIGDKLRRETSGRKKGGVTGQPYSWININTVKCEIRLWIKLLSVYSFIILLSFHLNKPQRFRFHSGNKTKLNSLSLSGIMNVLLLHKPVWTSSLLSTSCLKPGHVTWSCDPAAAVVFHSYRDDKWSVNEWFLLHSFFCLSLSSWIML